jgi:hypothetical protein
MGKKHATFADGDIGRGLRPVLCCPRINGVEQNAMCTENVVVLKALYLGELSKRFIQPGRERCVFKAPNNVDVFLLLVITQVALRFEIAARIECHSPDSRK